ncbi:MAG TPA: M56 family metallopeptidase [Armatimonadota bacterium]|nr:M56 family metallopeptidase [Armatimonadota bacterium]
MTGDRWIAVINVAASLWADTMGRACWHGGLALAVVWLLCCALPKLPPEIRCWLWRLAYAKLLVTFLWVSPVEVPLLPAQPPVQTTRGGTPEATLAQATELPWSSAQGAHLNSSVRAWAAPGVSPSALLFGVWLLGVCATCIWLGREVQRSRSLLRWCVPVREDAWNVCCAELSSDLGLPRTPRLLAVIGNGSPQVVGVVRPPVILPSSLLAECSATEVRLILAHELAHLKRRDLIWGWLAAVTHALFWFHPLVWLANSEWRTAQEIACDALAVRVTGAPVGDYGDVLVKVARRDRCPQSGLTALGVNGSAGTLRRRLTAMKYMRQVSRKRLMLAGVVLATLGVPALVSWRAVAQPAQDSPAGATITGRVVYEDGRPGTGVTVEARPLKGYLGGREPRRKQWQAKTGADGAYRLPGLQAEPSIVVVLSTGSTEWLGSSFPTVTPAAGRATQSPDLVLIPPPMLTGIVVNAKTGKPIAGVMMAAADADETPPVRQYLSSRTDREGRYRMQQEPGRRRLWIQGTITGKKNWVFATEYSVVVDLEKGQIKEVPFRVDPERLTSRYPPAADVGTPGARTRTSAVSAPGDNSSFVGVGLAIEPVPTADGYLRIIRVLSGGGDHANAAARKGDVITHVDGRSMQGKSVSEVIPRIRGAGAAGTTVRLTLRRQGVNRPLEVTLRRKVFSVQAE